MGDNMTGGSKAGSNVWQHNNVVVRNKQENCNKHGGHNIPGDGSNYKQGGN